MYNLLILAGAIASVRAFIDLPKNFVDSNCSDAEFFCANFECVPLIKQCDGSRDCSDGSDENDCEMYHCKPPDFFKCKNSRCISSAFVCDDENDCDDFSDEENCKDFKLNLERNSTCPEDQWQCTDKLCISKKWVCNGHPDCLDGSDEILGCSSTIECDGFKCKNHHCILKEWVCDGQDDCRDNSDEENCDAKIDPKDCTIEKNHFLCADSRTCIPLKQVCDGKTDCLDHSDENFSCNKTCEDCTHECVQLPTGPICVCPKGYRTTEDHHCEDINECEIYGICDQKCKNTPGSYQCFCEENYSLQSDKKSCKAHFGEATMFFTSKKQIREYALRSELYFPVAQNLKQAVGVDFDGRYVYWTDIFSEHESIVRSLKNGQQKELLVTAGLGAPEDLHIDYITKNIYFTDAERQHIGVCTNDGMYCTVLVKDIHKPRGIVLNPLEGEMYWTDWGHQPKISRAFMDGTNSADFVSTDIQWPNGLAIDHPNSRLYWTDAKLRTIESIHLDGTDRRIILQGVVKHPYAIAVFEGRLYWSDWTTHSIDSCDKFTGKNHHTLIKEKDYIYGITIYHPNNQKQTNNPCLRSMCSDICLLSKKSYKCACPLDKELGFDGHKCKEIEKRQKLIVGVDNILIKIEHKILGRHAVEALPVAVKKIGALAYNGKENLLYVSDVDTRKIIDVNLHSGIERTIAVGEIGEITAMDYDYLGNNLYWCDSELGTIEVFNFNTQSRTILVHDMQGEVPESIALVPEEGVMFVAFRRRDRHDSHVDRFLMDGTGRTHPIEEGSLGPVSLWYDNTLHRIFIADAGTGNIESTSVEGDDRHGFRSLQTSPIGITSLKSDVFWVNQFAKDIFWADKFNTGTEIYNKKITLDLPQDVEKLHITSITPQRIGLSPCQNNNGDCSHLCLQSQKKIVCYCPIGLTLDKDNKTCIQRAECNQDEFFCGQSNTCVAKHFRCDGRKNCPKGEDEEDCKKPNHCPLNYFQCHDGECIDEELRCNLKFDCRDKSDEHNCSHVQIKKCPPKHFTCKSGQCINERLVCDGVKDCPDEEDEDNCVATVCKQKEFRCLSGACIPKEWECDHAFDCPDFSDEHPGCPRCDPSTFTCNNGKCIDKSFVCDDENDCGDHSDEISCVKPLQQCSEVEFSCSNLCLPKNAVCNGTSECPNNEDEVKCSQECQPDEFFCKNKKCIPKEWICDRSDDCGDNSDEEITVCNHTLPVQTEMHLPCHNKFQCKNGKCIDFSLVCNSQSDCFDNSDEDGFCNTSCNPLNDPCSQICVKTPTGPMCKCTDGFSLQGDGHTCEDNNECDNYPPVCSQICHNSPGSYLCDCYEGFSLRSDRISCKAEGKPMSLIFVSSDNQIREMSQMENSLKLVYSEDTARITGLEASIDGIVYFSVESTGTIVRLNQTDSKHEYMEDIGQPQKLALDWLTNNIYFVNNDLSGSSISVCNFEDKSSAKLIKVDPHRQISAIAVDSDNRFLFYSLVSWWMFNSPNYVIYKANLDGTGIQELVKSSSGYITGLSFDLYKKELYFIDQHQNLLNKISYEGTKRTVLLTNLTRPNGLNLYENQLFFQSGSSMEKCRLYSSISCDSFRFRSEMFTIRQESRQPEGLNPCGNHTCSYMCIAAKMNYKCLCEDGKVVSPEIECDSSKREAGFNDRRKVISVHHHEHYASNPGPVIAGVMISICLLTFGALLFFLAKKRNSGTFNVISMRFHNPGYGLHHDEADKSILEPGQHEYTNPVEFYDAENTPNPNRREEILVNV